MKLFGIDVSEHQGVIDWNKVKESSDTAYVINRACYGDDDTSQDDKTFHRNAKECNRLGIPMGSYVYSYATSIAHVESEAKHILRLVKDYKIDYPLYLDLEDEIQAKADLVSMAIRYCEIIEAAGYTPGIYAGQYWWENKLNDSRLDKYEKWVAQYKDVPKSDYQKDHSIWQFSSTYKVAGIAGNVDVNWCYKDLTNGKVEVKPVTVAKKEDLSIVYQGYTNGRWLPNVVNNANDDDAGIDATPLECVYANIRGDKDLQYRVHIQGRSQNDWLPWVTNRTDFAGIEGHIIDGIQFKSPDNVDIKYRVKISNRWLSWVINTNDYAGLYGNPIYHIQLVAAIE